MKKFLFLFCLTIGFESLSQNYYDDPFNVGDLGPGGGVIFYEKADWTDGWKYLEAADEKWLNGVPTVSGQTGDYVQAFGTSVSDYHSTVNTLGYGDQNTYNTASYHNNRNNLMFNNVYGNVRGWFLPSLNEAYELYDYKLVDNSVLNLENAVYYTSSTDPGNVNVAWTLNMSNRYHGYSGKGGGLRKRAIRKVKLNDVKNRDNKSLHFDSVTDGLIITNDDVFATSSTADFNFMFWIKPMTSGFILSKYKHLDATNSDFYIRYQADTQQIQFTGNGTDVMLFGTVPLNQWSFIAITVVDGLVKGYVDGVLQASANINFSDNTQQQQLYIGATPDIKNLDNTGWENNSFTGYLDDLSVWWGKTPPSPGFVESEILSYKSISPLGVERQLAGYWNFDEGFDNISTFGTVYNSTVGTSSPELSSVVSFDYAKAPTDLGFYTDDSTPLSQTITFNNSVGENYVVSELRANDLDTGNLTVTFDSNSGQTNNNSDFSISGSQLIMPNTTTHGTYNVDLITSDGQRQLRKRVVVNVVDNVVPTISISASNGSSTVSDGSTIKDNTLYFTFTVSESTATFTIEDISVSGGTLSNFSGSGTSYTVTFIPSSDGAFALDIDAGVFTDAAGNNNVQSSEFNWNLDSTGPITTITANGAINSILDGSASNDTIVTLTFTINETTTDFTAEDITISGGTLSGFSGSGTQYIVYVFPDVEGDLTIDIDPSLFTDALGNGNSVADQFNWIYDITKPGMVITVSDGENTISNGSATNDAIVNLTFTSNEVTTDFIVEDVMVSGGTLSEFSGSGSIYTAIFTPTTQGSMVIDIDPSVFTDAAGNGNTAADQFKWTYDITLPNVAFKIDATGSSENLSATITATMDKVSTSNTYINFAASGTAVINQDYESTLDLTNKFSVVAGGNGIGNNTNQLSGPEQVAVDSKGNVYVVQEDNTVRKWMYGALNGQIIDGFGESSPMTNIKIDDSDNIFILHLNGIIKKYNSDFSLLSTYQAPPTGYQYYAFDIVNDDESAYIIDFSVDAVLYKTTVSSSTAVMNTSSHFAEGLAIYDDQNIFVVGNNMSLSRYNMSTKESNSYFDYQNCRDIVLNSEKNLVVTSDVVLSYSGSPGLLREIVLDESFNIKKEITLLTKQDFYNSNNIAVNESGLTQSGYEEIGISGVAQDVVGNYHLSLSKSSSRFGTNFDNTLEDRVIKYQTSPIIEITAGELQGSIMFKGIEDQLFSEGIKTIILTPSAINATLASTNAITIYLLDNSFTFSPVIAADTISLAENSPNSTVVGIIEASDADGDTLTYSIINGNSDQAFDLGSMTGQLTVADSTALDFEMTPVFSLLIKVSDGALSDSAAFTINLTDVDEDSTTTNQAPTITAGTFSLAENSLNSTVLGTVEASDPDGDSLTYNIINGNSDQAFGLDSTTGQLTVADRTALDFEMTPVFSLLIKVSDGALSDSATFTINLIDVDEEEEEILSLADAAEMIYPNPSSGIINIRMNQFKEATIYNLSGKRIMKAIDNRIDISALSEGVYIIRLENRSGDRFAMRLIKE